VYGFIAASQWVLVYIFLRTSLLEPLSMETKEMAQAMATTHFISPCMKVVVQKVAEFTAQTTTCSSQVYALGGALESRSPSPSPRKSYSTNARR